MDAERISPEELRDTLVGFYLDVNHGGSIVKGTVCDPAGVADVIFRQLSANRAHEDRAASAHACCECADGFADRELSAMAAAVAALGRNDWRKALGALLPLDLHERARAVRWLASRYPAPADDLPF